MSADLLREGVGEGNLQKRATTLNLKKKTVSAPRPFFLKSRKTSMFLWAPRQKKGGRERIGTLLELQQVFWPS
jgi:hypothetical protein